MTTLRWVAIFIGLLSLVWSFWRFRMHRSTRFDFCLGFLFSLCLVTAGAYPKAATLLRDLLALENAAFSRLLALLIVSNLGLWFLVMYQRGKTFNQEYQFEQMLIHSVAQAYFQRYPLPTNPEPITIIIPAYNEAENLAHVLARIPKAIQGKAVLALVVDDGSDDGTALIAQTHNAHAVTVPVRRGGGAAIRVGFHLAQARGSIYAVTMDGDGQHLGEEIPNLIRPLLKGEADVVIGSRLKGQREKDSSLRLAGIHLFNRLIRLLTPVAITDCSNGFRALRLKALAKLELRQNQYHTAELIIEASRKGLAIQEVGITVKRRLSGESKKGRNWRYGFRFMVTILKTWWR